MNKGILYIALIGLLAGSVGFVLIKDRTKQKTYSTIKDRTGKLAQLPDWIDTKTKANTLLETIQNNPKDIKAKLQLASLYIQESRITGDHLYYDQAAMHLVDAVLKSDSTEFEALCFKSMLFLSEHHFSDGLKHAQTAQKLNPYNSFVYGLLTDAQVELGHYKEAVEMADQMVTIRPDLRSYSRVSYLREIFGDYAGAIDAMKLAVSAGYPGAEETEWARVQLGHLYENNGQREEAKSQYQMALSERSEYPYAFAGLGRIAKAEKKYPESIAYFLKADSLVGDYSFKDELIDLYQWSSQAERSREIAKSVLDKLNSDASGGAKDAAVGHYADRELAYIYIKMGDYDRALEHALLEYNRRPDNIDVNEAVAWSYYQKKDIKNAEAYITVALKTGSQSPTLLSRAALIYTMAGNKTKAQDFIKRATVHKAYIQEDVMQSLTKLMAS